MGPQKQVGVRSLALVTGAGSGLGLSFAACLARRGYDLLLVSLPGEDLLGTARKLEASYAVKCHGFEGDLTSEGICDQVADRVKEIGLGLELFVCNAGLGSTSPFLDLPASFYERQVMLNAAVPTVLTRLLFSELSRSGKGRILMVSSMGAFLHVPGKAVYDATKAFLLSFGRSLGPFAKSANIQICMICPGPINTNERLRKTHAELKGIARKLVMEPDDVAEESLNALFHGRELFIPGKWNRFMYRLLSLVPDRLVQVLLQNRIGR